MENKVQTIIEIIFGILVTVCMGFALLFVYRAASQNIWDPNMLISSDGLAGYPLLKCISRTFVPAMLVVGLALLFMFFGAIRRPYFMVLSLIVIAFYSSILLTAFVMVKSGHHPDSYNPYRHARHSNLMERSRQKDRETIQQMLNDLVTTPTPDSEMTHRAFIAYVGLIKSSSVTFPFLVKGLDDTRTSVIPISAVDSSKNVGDVCYSALKIILLEGAIDSAFQFPFQRDNAATWFKQRENISVKELQRSLGIQK